MKINEKDVLIGLGGISPEYIGNASDENAVKYSRKKASAGVFTGRIALVAAVVLLLGAMIVTGVMLSKKDRTPEIPDIEEPDNTEPKEPEVKEPEEKQIETKTDYVILPNVPRNTPFEKNDYNVEIDGSFFEMIKEEANKRIENFVANAPKTIDVVINGEEIEGVLAGSKYGAGRLTYDGYRKSDGARLYMMVADMETHELCGYLPIPANLKPDKSLPIVPNDELLAMAREKAKEFIDIEKYEEEILDSEDDFTVIYTFCINGVRTEKSMNVFFSKYGGVYLGYDKAFFSDFSEDEINETGLAEKIKEADYERIEGEVIDYVNNRLSGDKYAPNGARYHDFRVEEIRSTDLVKIADGTYALKIRVGYSYYMCEGKLDMQLDGSLICYYLIG